MLSLTKIDKNRLSIGGLIQALYVPLSSFLARVSACSGWDFFLNRRIEISKLATSFPRIAPVRLFRRSVHDFFGLNTEPMNRAVGGSHLYPVRQAKKAEQNALFGHKKYSQPNSRIETCRRFDYLKTS